jgi:hypothetical protein
MAVLSEVAARYNLLTGLHQTGYDLFNSHTLAAVSSLKIEAQEPGKAAEIIFATNLSDSREYRLAENIIGGSVFLRSAFLESWSRSKNFSPATIYRLIGISKSTINSHTEQRLLAHVEP